MDVTIDQLDWKLRNGSRVSLPLSATRDICDRDDIGEPAELVTVDVSFISVTKILPAHPRGRRTRRRFPDSDQAAIRAGEAGRRQGRNRSRRVAAPEGDRPRASRPRLDAGLEIVGVRAQPLARRGRKPGVFSSRAPAAGRIKCNVQPNDSLRRHRLQTIKDVVSSVVPPLIAWLRERKIDVFVDKETQACIDRRCRPSRARHWPRRSIC